MCTSAQETRLESIGMTIRLQWTKTALEYLDKTTMSQEEFSVMEDWLEDNEVVPDSFGILEYARYKARTKSINNNNHGK